MISDLEIKTTLPSYCGKTRVSLILLLGSITVLTGPSGSGKTILLQTIAGLERPDYTTIKYKNKEWANAVKQLAPYQREAVYVSQRPQLFSHLDLAENLSYGGNLLEDSYYQELIRVFDLKDSLQNSVEHFSGGETQKASILQALGASPEVLLLDEPFTGLDWVSKKKVMIALKNYLELKSITLILVTHSLEEMKFFSDEIIYLTRGNCQRLSVTEIE